MKAELVYNVDEKPRVLITLEDPEEGMRMAFEPNLDLVVMNCMDCGHEERWI